MVRQCPGWDEGSEMHGIEMKIDREVVDNDVCSLICVNHRSAAEPP